MTAVWGHRGASKVRPENTVEAFREAVRLGADGVELDVRRTADGALAVAHDAALPDGRLLVQLDADDLPDGVPLLGDALDALDGRTVNVEIKNLPGEPDHDPEERLAVEVARLVGRLGLHEAVLVSSFAPTTVDRVRAEDPSVATALLAVIPPDADVAGRTVDRCRRAGHRALHPHHAGVTPQLVALCRAAGLACNTWTVDDPTRMADLAALGVDAIVTNDVETAVATLRP